MSASVSTPRFIYTLLLSPPNDAQAYRLAYNKTLAFTTKLNNRQRTLICVYKQIFCVKLCTNALSGTPNVQKMQAVNAKQMSDVIFCILEGVRINSFCK